MAYWLAEANCADGAHIEKKAPYTDEYNYRREEETIFRLEEEIINIAEKNHGGCEWYSVSFQADDE